MRPLLMGMTCFGSYIDTFFNYCLPSLMAPGNLPLLSQHRDVAIVIHTDKEGEARFRERGFKAAIFADVNHDIEDKYQMIGIHQHQDLATAKEHGADYHLLMPDFIYSENCFAGVLKVLERGETAIARLVMSTVQETISPELATPRSATDLATLSLQHIHPGVENWLMQRNWMYPQTHVLAWKTANALVMCSPHCTPVYIANEAIKSDDSNLPLDCILDRIIDGPIYLPKPEDDIVIIEISPKNSRERAYQKIGLGEFCRIFKWDTKNSLKQLDIFMQETVDPIWDIPGINWNEVEISQQKFMVIEAIEGA